MAGTFVGWGGRPKGEPTKVDDFHWKSPIFSIYFCVIYAEVTSPATPSQFFAHLS